jgi:MHS family proline/betaine transporter-like MFS transporter
LGLALAFPFRTGDSDFFGLFSKKVLTHIPEHSNNPEYSMLNGFRLYWRKVLQVFGICVTVNTGYYIFFVYALNFLIDDMHFSVQKAMEINTICLLLITITPAIFAPLSDRFGRKPILFIGLIALFCTTGPFWWLMHHHSAEYVLAGQIGFCIVMGLLFAVNPATMVEILPSSHRISLLGVSYNLTMSIFGGTAPMFVLYMTHRTHDDYFPVYYVMSLCVISLISIFTFKEPRGKSLD